MADVNIEDGVAAVAISEYNDIFDRLKKSNATGNADKLQECFETFDKDRDGTLDRSEFSNMLKCLFSRRGRSYRLSRSQEETIFKLMDEDQDGKINREEFKVCWYHWIKQIIDPVSALVIVDVQNDFISGTLAIKHCPAGQDGEAVVPVINQTMDESNFDYIVYSLDWHPSDHISFIENVNKRKIHHTSKVSAESAQVRDEVVFQGPPVTEQKLWPSHCVQNTEGAKLHPDLQIDKKGIYIKKGTNSDVDSYSAFWDNKKFSQTSLVSELTERGVTDVYVCGLAYDVCVGATTLHSVEHGFRTTLIEDACRGVSLEDIDAIREKLKRGGAAVVQSSQVADMVSGDDRRPELGYQAAINVSMARRLVREGQHCKK